MYYIGIDWADHKYDVVVLDDNGNHACPNFEIDKTADDFDRFVKKLNHLSSKTADFKICIETPHNLIVDFLLDKNYPVFLLPPSSMKSFRKRYRTTNARDDHYDAFVIADVARTDKTCCKIIEHPSSLTRQITELVFDHHRIVDRKVAIHNAFKQTLKSYFPEYLYLFSDISCQSSIAFFQQHPTIDSARRQSQQQLVDFFKTRHYFRKNSIQKMYRILQSNYLKVDQQIIRIKSARALFYAGLLDMFNVQFNECFNNIKQRLDIHPDADIFRSFPGVADLSAARLIALFKDNRDLYHTPFPFQAKAGTCPVTEVTGHDKKRKKIHKVVYFRKGCNKVYRDFVQLIAFSSITKSEWCNQYYRQHRKKGQSHSQALRCLANTQLRILFAMWKKRIPYDENIYLAQKLRHDSKTTLNQKNDLRLCA
jgi:transposase